MFFEDFFGLFRQSFVCFGCFDTCPKHRKKTEKNFWFRETNRNRLSFGLFWYEPKKKFDCFEDTLGQAFGIPLGAHQSYSLKKVLGIEIMN